jgi:hypothetical protein
MHVCAHGGVEGLDDDEDDEDLRVGLWDEGKDL